MKTILIAEDEFDLLDALKHVFEDQGFAVMDCKDGVQALERLHEERPALVITDVMMPRLSGVELVERMLAEDKLKNIPVIVISCAQMPPTTWAPNVIAFLRKPFALQDLLREVNKVVDNGYSYG